MSCANRFCANFPTHRHQTRALVNARAKMAGFSCSAILALYLTAITFPEGDALSVNRDKATTSPSSNTSLAHVKTPTSIPTSNGYVQDQKPTASGNNDLYTEDSDMYKLRIEIIKAKILKKLQMDKQPVVHIEKTKDKMIADLLLSLNLIDMNDDDSETEEYEDRKYDKTSKLIVFGEKAKVSPSKSKRKFSEKLIFQFRIEPKSLSSLVPSAFLWVHKRKSRQHELRKKTLHIYAHDKESPRGTSKVPIRRTTKTKLKSKRTGSGWEMIDVKEIVRHWFNKTANQYDAGNGTGNGTDNGVQALEISCLDCDSNVSQLINSRGRLRPFLVIDLEKPRTLKRKKREDNGCPAGQAVSCCRRTFYVDFVKIGWDWVIHPQGFYANFCEGSCDSLHTRVTSERAIILQEAAKKNLGPPAYTGSCCSPTKMLPFSMLYWDDEYNIAKKDLQDLKVKECGCS